MVGEPLWTNESNTGYCGFKRLVSSMASKFPLGISKY